MRPDRNPWLGCLIQQHERAILTGMGTPLFDTRHATDTLIAGGIQEDHANAIVTVLDECLHRAVAKTSDLNELKAELKAEIAGQANKTIVTMIALAGVIIAAIKLF